MNHPPPDKSLNRLERLGLIFCAFAIQDAWIWWVRGDLAWTAIAAAILAVICLLTVVVREALA